MLNKILIFLLSLLWIIDSFDVVGLTTAVCLYRYGGYRYRYRCDHLT